MFNVLNWLYAYQRDLVFYLPNHRHCLWGKIEVHPSMLSHRFIMPHMFLLLCMVEERQWINWLIKKNEKTIIHNWYHQNRLVPKSKNVIIKKASGIFGTKLATRLYLSIWVCWIQICHMPSSIWPLVTSRGHWILGSKFPNLNLNFLDIFMLSNA